MPILLVKFICLIPSTSSAIIQEAEVLRNAGLAFMAYFYCDFRERSKQDVRGLLTSLLVQLCAESGSFSQVLSDQYSKHNAGSRQPDDGTLMQCLKRILQLPRQQTVYLIVDALDECPNTAGIVSARDHVLEFVEELIGLHLTNLRICLTSRPEADILASLGPLSPLTFSLHEQRGQKNDIEKYVNSVVHSDRNMRRWREEDKKMVIDTLSDRADGM